MRLVVDSVLDVDHQAWRAVLGELGDPRTGLVGEAQVPGALCLEVAALDQVHEREKTRIEIGRVTGRSTRAQRYAGPG